MFDNFGQAFASDTSLDLANVFLRLVLALALGILVALVHRFTRLRIGRQPDGALAVTLVMLCVLLALTTVVVGDNVARAFSIVGALSIVRFRTVVEDTRDTAFVVFAVVIGLAVGTGYLWLPLLAIPVVAVAAMHSSHSSRRISIRTGIGLPRAGRTSSRRSRRARGASSAVARARGAAGRSRTATTRSCWSPSEISRRSWTNFPPARACSRSTSTAEAGRMDAAKART